MKINHIFSAGLLIFATASYAATNSAKNSTQKPLKIGFAMDTLKEERWQKDKELFVKEASARGAEVLVQAANGNAMLQISQAENLLTQGVDVLVVVPTNGITAAKTVELAHKAGKKVLSYDRLIRNADVDLYVSFDNVEVGRRQAAYLLKRVPKGNYLLIGGAPTDNNAQMLRDGQMEILKPAIDRKDIVIVGDQWAKDWQASEALKHTENALTKMNNKIDAVVASNDGTAGGVIAALSQQKLAGKVLVSGMDADLAACQRIVDGSQSLTIYKPIKDLATKAAEAAIALGKGTQLVGSLKKVNNGKIDVPALLLEPIQVDRNNLEAEIVKNGFHSAAEVFKNARKG